MRGTKLLAANPCGKCRTHFVEETDHVCCDQRATRPQRQPLAANVSSRWPNKDRTWSYLTCCYLTRTDRNYARPLRPTPTLRTYTYCSFAMRVQDRRGRMKSWHYARMDTSQVRFRNARYSLASGQFSARKAWINVYRKFLISITRCSRLRPLQWQSLHVTDTCSTANETMASVLRATTDQLLAENFWESLVWKSSGIRDDAAVVLSNGIEKRREAQLTGQSRDEMWLDWRVSRFMAEGHTYLLLTANDITQWKLAEQRSARAAQEWERTFDAVPDTIMILDEQQRIVRMNKAAADRFGVSPGTSVGNFCFEVVHGKEHRPSHCPFRLLRKDSGPYFEEIVDERLEGVFEVRVSPVIDSDGNLAGCVHVARDITEHKRLQGTLTKNIAELTSSREQILAVTKNLEARVKELNCLYSMSKIRENDCLSFNELFQAIVNIIPAAWQYPDIVCTRLVLAGHEFRTANFQRDEMESKGCRENGGPS